jgi:hypothetical protein
MKHSRQSLKETIRILELRQEEEKELFNQQLRTTFESLKPANLIKSTLRDISHHTLELKNNLLEAFLPLITNFISGRLVNKSRKNSFFHLIATMLQMALTNFAAKNSHAILSYFTDLLDYLKGFFSKVQKADKEAEFLNEPEVAPVEEPEENKTCPEDPDKQAE